MYDSEASFKQGDSLVCILDNQGHLDFNRLVVSEPDPREPTKLIIKLEQLEELIGHESRAQVVPCDFIKDYRHVLLKSGGQATVALRNSG